MKLKWLAALPLLLVSCIDITDEILIKAEGGGVFQRTTDYTAAFKTINNAEDSIAMVNQAEQDHQNLKSKFAAVSGIHNLNSTRIYGTDKYRIGFEFDNWDALNKALLEDGDTKTLFEWKKGELTLTGGVPGLRDNLKLDSSTSGATMLIKSLENAHYTLQITAPRKIKKCSNKLVSVKKNKLAYGETLDKILLDPSKTQMTIKYK